MSKVAIIEDDQVISQMYRMKFEAEGFEVGLAENGKTGLELIENSKPDIVLLDLQMPEMSGAEALAKMRAQPWGKHIPVIVLTNIGREEAPKEVRTLGVHSYIVKAEATPRQVVGRVKTALGLDKK